MEIDELDALIGPLVTAINPTLIGLPGVGTDVAGQLLVTAGDNDDCGCASNAPGPGRMGWPRRSPGSPHCLYRSVDH